MIAHLPGGAAVGAVISACLLGAAVSVLVFPGESRRARRRAWLTAGGVASLGVAVSAPVEALADRTFSAHMLQHLVLMVVAPAMLVAGRAMSTLLATGRQIGVVPARRSGLARRCRAAAIDRGAVLLATAAVLHALVLTFWHLPSVFESAVDNPLVHAVEHASMLTAGLALFAAWGMFARRAPVPAFAATFATAVHGAAVGALITFAARPVYAVADGTASLGDQQLAGLLMWIPTGLVYVVLAALVVWRSAIPPRPPVLRPAEIGPAIGEGGRT